MAVNHRLLAALVAKSRRVERLRGTPEHTAAREKLRAQVRKHFSGLDTQDLQHLPRYFTQYLEEEG